MTRSLLQSLALCFVSAAALAQSPYAAKLRNFPPDAQKGVLLAPIHDHVVINNKVLKASSGLQIRNENNLIVMPSTLQGTLPVRYQFDQTSSVWRIWILTAAEQAVPDLKK